MIEVSINNQLHSIEEESTLIQVIDKAGFSNQPIAIALNGEFVAKSLYQEIKISHKDTIDIVKPIGGG